MDKYLNDMNAQSFGAQEFKEQTYDNEAEQTSAGQFIAGGGGKGGRSIRPRDAAPDYRNPWKDINALFETSIKGVTEYDRSVQKDKFDAQQQELMRLTQDAEDNGWTPEHYLTEKERIVNRHITEEPLWRYKTQQIKGASDVATQQWQMEQKKIEADEAAASRLDAQTAIDTWDQTVGQDVVAGGPTSADPLPAGLGGGQTGDVVSPAPNILSGTLEEATSQVVDHVLAARYGQEFSSFPPERQKRIRDTYTKQFSSEVLRRRRELRALEEASAKKEADITGTINIGENAPEVVDGAMTDDSRDDMTAFIEAPGAALTWEDKVTRAGKAAEMGLDSIMNGGEGTLTDRYDQMKVLIDDPIWDTYFGEDADAKRKGLQRAAKALYISRVDANSRTKGLIVIEQGGINLTPEDADSFRDEQLTALGLTQDEEGKWITPIEGTPQYDAMSRVLSTTSQIRSAAAAAGVQRAKIEEARKLGADYAAGADLTTEEQELIFDNAPSAQGLRDMARENGYDFADEEKVNKDLDAAVALLNNPTSTVPADYLDVITDGIRSNDPARQKAAGLAYSKLTKRHREQVTNKVGDDYDRYWLRAAGDFFEANPGSQAGTFVPMDRATYKAAVDGNKDNAIVGPDDAAREAYGAALGDHMVSYLTPADQRSFWGNDTTVDALRASRQYQTLLRDMTTDMSALVASGATVDEAAQIVLSKAADAGYRLMPDTAIMPNGQMAEPQFVVVKDKYGHLNFADEGDNKIDGNAYRGTDVTDRAMAAQLESATPIPLAGRMVEEMGLGGDMSPTERQDYVMGLAKEHGLAGPPYKQMDMLRVLSFEKINQQFEEEGSAFRLTELAQIPTMEDWKFDTDLTSEQGKASLTRIDGGAPVYYEFEVEGVTFTSRTLNSMPSLFLSQQRRGGTMFPPNEYGPLTPYNDPGPLPPLVR